MLKIRPVIAVVLAALIIVTSQGMAFARGQTMVAGQIVLCTGHGPEVINIDKDGKKVATAHICPDCALALLATSDVPDISVSFDAGAGSSHPVLPQSLASVATVRNVNARGPPVLV